MGPVFTVFSGSKIGPSVFKSVSWKKNRFMACKLNDFDLVSLE